MNHKLVLKKYEQDLTHVSKCSQSLRDYVLQPAAFHFHLNQTATVLSLDKTSTIQTNVSINVRILEQRCRRYAACLLILSLAVIGRRLARCFKKNTI
ncbi:hypothetical protein TNCV_75111 [Trichonephila clavipes]|nr:hypothetical protein TNCV_75111 [Trichonephila clavipes]